MLIPGFRAGQHGTNGQSLLPHRRVSSAPRAWMTMPASPALPTERVPLWAACWLVDDYDGQKLAELAGLHGDDPHDVRNLLPDALIECGVSNDDLRGGDRSRTCAAAVRPGDTLVVWRLDRSTHRSTTSRSRPGQDRDAT
jgi:hypothetical protein